MNRTTETYVEEFIETEIDVTYRVYDTRKPWACSV